MKPILIILMSILLLTGCTTAAMEFSTKREVHSYEEKKIDLHTVSQVDITCDSTNLHVYTWDKNSVKFEITRRIRGTEEEKTLKDKLDNFKIDITKSDDKLSFNSYYKGKISNPADKSVDLKVYIPKSSLIMNCKVDIGNIKFFDDMKGVLNADINMANIEINKFDGVLNVTGDVGNVKLSAGRLEEKSSIIKNMGNISVKSKFEEDGEYIFKTNVGNIDMCLPENSKMGFESIGTLEVNEFEDVDHPSKIKVNTDMGKISIKKY